MNIQNIVRNKSIARLPTYRKKTLIFLYVEFKKFPINPLINNRPICHHSLMFYLLSNSLFFIRSSTVLNNGSKLYFVLYPKKISIFFKLQLNAITCIQFVFKSQFFLLRVLKTKTFGQIIIL